MPFEPTTMKIYCNVDHRSVLTRFDPLFINKYYRRIINFIFRISQYNPEWNEIVLGEDKQPLRPTTLPYSFSLHQKALAAPSFLLKLSLFGADFSHQVCKSHSILGFWKLVREGKRKSFCVWFLNFPCFVLFQML